MNRVSDSLAAERYLASLQAQLSNVHNDLFQLCKLSRLMNMPF